MTDSSAFVDLKIPAAALDRDDLAVHSPAEIEVIASAGEFDGILVGITRPDVADNKYASVEVTLDGARQIIASITTAAADTYELMTPAVSCHDGSRASVEVAGAPAEFAGVYLALIEHDLMSRAAVLVDHQQAGSLIDALTTAIDYLTEHGYT